MYSNNNDCNSVKPHSNLNFDPKAALEYIITRQVTLLFKEFLSILEKGNDEHNEGLNKLYEALPDQYKGFVNLADWWTPEKAARLRKEVLQRGNDALRNVKEELDKYKIDLK